MRKNTGKGKKLKEPKGVFFVRILLEFACKITVMAKLNIIQLPKTLWGEM